MTLTTLNLPTEIPWERICRDRQYDRPRRPGSSGSGRVREADE
jgi:hypothetical protein